jgi:CPA2 family monovalent cation:H+ antiporter-2
VSFALGAFFAGMVVNGSDLSHEAAADSLPLQDAFSVLFFVAVGMLFGPAILVRQPIQVLAVVAIVMFGKSLGAFAIVLAFGYPIHTAALISASLAQVGEFSFILAALGVSLGLMPPEGQSLIVAGAILSISLNPLAFGAAARGARWIAARPSLLAKLERNVRPHAPAPEEPTPVASTNHAIIVGFGRVGSVIGGQLAQHTVPFVVVEQERETADMLRKRGLSVITGDASQAGVLEQANVGAARLLVITAPDRFKARAVVTAARPPGRRRHRVRRRPTYPEPLARRLFRSWQPRWLPDRANHRSPHAYREDHRRH